MAVSIPFLDLEWFRHYFADDDNYFAVGSSLPSLRAATSDWRKLR